MLPIRQYKMKSVTFDSIVKIVNYKQTPLEVEVNWEQEARDRLREFDRKKRSVGDILESFLKHLKLVQSVLERLELLRFNSDEESERAEDGDDSDDDDFIQFIV